MNTEVPTYRVASAFTIPPPTAIWDDPAWDVAETAEISNFRPESSEHRPRTFVRLLHAATGLHGIFRVEDRYIRCVRAEYQSAVFKDSCVEFFAQPKAGGGYFNFEFNCGGAFLCCYIINPERTKDGFKEFTRIPPAIGRTIRAIPSRPGITDPEITASLVWTLQFFVPFTLFESYIGRLGNLPGQAWRGNFFKCAEEISHPHWAAWSPVHEFNFHLPGCFGNVRFDSPRQ